MPRKDESRTVYTTESGRICPDCGRPLAQCAGHQKRPTPVGDGVIRVSREKKGRGGKTVTLITGISGSEDERKVLAAEIKRRCGTGGTFKEGLIEIQGDHRDAIIAFLKEKNLRNIKRVGGD